MVVALSDLATNAPEIQCTFHYLSKLPQYEVNKPYYFSGPLPADQEHNRTNLEYTKHSNIQIRDIRAMVSELSIEEHGFQLIRHESEFAVKNPNEANLEAFLTEMSSIVQDFFNADFVVCYAYRFRKQTEEAEKKMLKGAPGTLDHQDAPIFTPHTDQTLDGARRRAARHLSTDEQKAYLDGTQHRLRLINCWRPLRHSAEEKPLAFCDYKSIQHSVSLKAADRASREYVGEIYYLQHASEQQWYYISNQMPDEVILFTNHDSHPVDGGPAYMAHSSFKNEMIQGAVHSRESLETSFIVINKL